MPHPHASLASGQLHVCTGGKPLQMAAEFVQKVNLNLGPGENTQTWVFSTVLGKVNRRLLVPSQALQGKEKAYKLKMLLSKGDTCPYCVNCCVSRPSRWVPRQQMDCCLVAESCATFCDPMDCSPPGSSVYGISKVRLKWVAISSSRGSSWTRNQTHVSFIGRWVLYHWAPPGKSLNISLSFCR